MYMCGITLIIKSHGNLLGCPLLLQLAEHFPFHLSPLKVSFAATQSNPILCFF